MLAHTASGYFVYGAFGIGIFFVISGVIITPVHARATDGTASARSPDPPLPAVWLFRNPLVMLGWGGDAMHLLSSVTLWPVIGADGMAWTAPAPA